MKYWKLLIPIPIAIMLTVFAIPFEHQNYYPLVGDIVKGGLLIYYLRLDNSNTPLINSLTTIVLVMMLGEYLLFHERSMSGQVLFVIANMSLGLTYFFRQRLKAAKDRLAGLKTLAVFVYSLMNILYSFEIMSVMPIIIGVIFLYGVYFYDRVLRIEKV